MIYIVTGHLGSGKSLVTVDMAMNRYLRQGRRVASNITLLPENALPAQSKSHYIKIPYIPRADHLESLGKGYEGDYDEQKFGLVILDEAGSWLNSRDWADKDRRGLFTWITHARKHGWDVALIVQDWESLDAQIRKSVCEIFVKCSRLDRVKIPYLPLKAPKIHRATARYGGPDGPLYERWHTRGTQVHSWYDTREAVRPEITYTEAGQVDARAVWSGLSPYHLVGRYQGVPLPWTAARVLTVVTHALLTGIGKVAAAVLAAPAPPPVGRPPSKLVSHSHRAYRLGLTRA